MVGVIVRVLLIDDHPVVLDGLTIALEAHGVEIAGRARTLAEARTLLATVEAEVALLDLRLPDGSGTDLLSGAGDAADGPAFIVLSTFQTPQYVAAAVALGASGFVAKTAPTEDIVDAVRVVADGGTAFPREMARPARNRWNPLTPREHDIIAGVLAGQIERRAGCGSAHRAEDGGGLPHPALRTVRRAVTHGARDPRRTRAVAEPAGPGADCSTQHQGSRT